VKHGYSERWDDLVFIVDKVGESPDGNHLVEVIVHDRPVTEEMSVRMYISKEYYGSMIPWLATRVVISDLAASSLERVRRLESRRLEPQVHLENQTEYLQALESVPGLSQKVMELPEAAIRGHMMFLKELNPSPGDRETSASVSLHNAHKLVFDRGLPDTLEFFVDADGTRSILARWVGRGTYVHQHSFWGFDWKTVEGQAALDDFIGMLNPRAPLRPEQITPKRIPRRKGPKEWSPDEYHSFMLIKGRDYGRPA